MDMGQPIPLKTIDVSNDAVGSDDWADVGDALILNGLYERLVFQVQNNGEASGDDLADFEISVKTHPAADWHAYLTGVAWANTSNLIQTAVVTNPSTLVRNGRAFVGTFLGPVYAMKFKAKADTGKTTKIRIVGFAKGSLR
jgi:hypothetical protein